MCKYIWRRPAEPIWLFMCTWCQGWPLCNEPPVRGSSLGEAVPFSQCSLSRGGTSQFSPSTYICPWMLTLFLFHCRLSGILALIIFLPPLLQCPLSHGWKSCYIDAFLGVGLPLVCGSLHFVHLGFSVTVFICCKERILWWCELQVSL